LRTAGLYSAPVKRFFRYNGLSLVLLVFFLVTWLIGQVLSGEAEYNEDRKAHGLSEVTTYQYLQSPHFWEASTENWESEFFQMSVFVVFTTFLYQKGSAESADPDKPRTPEPPVTKKSPWPVRRGGWVKAVYSYSLSIALFFMFLVSFALHAVTGARLYSEEQVLHGDEPVSLVQYLGTSQFWFESFQNWQSEFLAIGVMVVFSVFLRQKDSPESKPVNAPHSANE